MGLSRSSKMRPINGALEAVRFSPRPLRFSVGLVWTASNSSRDQGLVLAGVAGALVVDLAEVDPIAQQVRERAVGERHAANYPARGKGAGPGENTGLPQLPLQGWQAAEHEVAADDEPDRLGF